MRKLLVLLSAVAFLVAFTVPAVAADWNFYGSARVNTFFSDVEPEGGDSSTDLGWDLGNSLYGANAEAGDIGGGIEYTAAGSLRKLFGTWSFGGGSLMVGQNYTPVNMFYSSQVYGGDTSMLPYGGIYDGRRPMLQLSMSGFKVALVQTGTADIVSPENEASLPKIEASYSFNAGPLALNIAAGYNTYDEITADDTYSIDSYFAGLGFKMGFGAGYLGGDIYTGGNLGPFGIWGGGMPEYSPADNKVLDTSDMGYLLVAGFTASDVLSFQLGYGNKTQEVDGGDELETAAYYAQAKINLAKGCFIVPEIGMIDTEDVSETTYYGAKWQIDF
jgi:hypothetical protein